MVICIAFEGVGHLAIKEKAEIKSAFFLLRFKQRQQHFEPLLGLNPM